ncbi:hypothetical protein GCM10007036_17470 [Alsobacter metallidurans]|uniref:SnoaL-like domain-containing protein n=1 Tax=Alsobacter metallidurans TaxID=340221 RepID=A0A917MJB9_9HYPH|nr:nuclear transport factor 2 family protein [Alsobacter metallidurans]GGH16628.1 hypothetical protein GCM10007036_17470 [Alsobacter metallidurans]
MTDHNTLAARYIEAWNERDPSRRRSLVEALWSPDGSYVDPLGAARGHAEIDGLIGAIQDRFPGMAFKPAGKADGYGNHVRFSWTLGPADADALAGGTDFAVVADGRLAAVTGFLDFAPTAA